MRDDVSVHAFLETERLVLRRFTAADADDLHALDNDPEVMRYINGGLPVSREEVEHQILPRFLWYHDQGDDFGFWAAEERGTGRFLGWFHFRPDPDGANPGEPELGYRLIRDAWGRGYASEGSAALVRYGFETLRVPRIYATTMAVNLASQRVMEKAGLRFVRTFHQDWPYRIEGEEEGDVEYALTLDEWRAREGS